jgi:Ser/Thr protein kinase RdoA (MazF antagonist)
VQSLAQTLCNADNAKARGRARDELDLAQAEQLGRLVARMHSVGKKKRAEHRLLLNVENFGERPLDLLLKGQWIAIEVQSRYEDAAKKIFEKIKPLFANLKNQRIHGDCHRGNLLFSGPSAFFLDFDDMVEGPAVQDVWLATPEPEIRESFLIGYESMLSFDRVQLKLIEPLRALRIINYSAWIAKRWEDPYFKRIFTEFKSYRYWASEVENLELVARLI